MKKILIILLLCSCMNSFSQDIPQPTPNSYVSDYVGILKPDEISALNNHIDNLKKKYTIEVGIAIIQSLGDYSIEDWALKMGRQWGIGGKSNNGLLVLISYDDHKWRIEVGPGLQGDIPDIIAKDFGENNLVPNFRAKTYYDGFESLLNNIDNRLDPSIKAIRQAEELKQIQERKKRIDAFVNVLLWILFAGVFLAIVYVFYRIYKSRKEIKENKIKLILTTKGIFDAEKKDLLRVKVEDLNNKELLMYSELLMNFNLQDEKSFSEERLKENTSKELSKKLDYIENYINANTFTRDRTIITCLLQKSDDLKRFKDKKPFILIYENILREALSGQKKFIQEKLTGFETDLQEVYDTFIAELTKRRFIFNRADNDFNEAFQAKEINKLYEVERLLEEEEKTLKSNLSKIEDRLNEAFLKKRYIDSFEDKVNKLRNVVESKLVYDYLQPTTVSNARDIIVALSSKEIELSKLKQYYNNSTYVTLKRFVDEYESSFVILYSEIKIYEDNQRMKREAEERRIAEERRKKREEEDRRRREEEEDRRRRDSYYSSSSSSFYSSSNDNSSSTTSSFGGGSFDGGGASGSW